MSRLEIMSSNFVHKFLSAIFVCYILQTPVHALMLIYVYYCIAQSCQVIPQGATDWPSSQRLSPRIPYRKYTNNEAKYSDRN